MANMNCVILIGRLTRDPEYRDFQDSGVTKFGLAVNNSKRVNGEWVDDPVFLDCECWNRGDNKLADRVSQFRKGQQVAVNGKLKMDKWTDNNSGREMTKIKVTADTVQSLERGQQEATPAPRQPQSQVSRPAVAGQTDASGLGNREIPF